MTVTRGARGRGYAAAMYTISRAPGSRSAVTLSCTQCSHTVSVDKFSDSPGCARTQAAQAMLKHVHNEHGKAPSQAPV